jgi:hypothetical protein
MGPMALTFAAPAALAGLVALPLLYFLLRVTPPRPREVVFPPLKLLLDLIAKEQTPSHTPWPLLLLRLAIAACIILAMAGPIFSPAASTPIGKAPLLLALDDGWPTAPSWERRLNRAASIAEDATRAGAPVALLLMSQGAVEPALEEGAKAVERLRSARPMPFAPDRAAAAARASAFAKAHRDARILWIADGLEQGGAKEFAHALQEAAKAGASVDILSDSHTPLALVAPLNAPGGLETQVLRADAQGPSAGRVHALDGKGRVVGLAAYDFAGGKDAKARFDLPTEMRNDISFLQIDGESSAGAVALLDSRSKVRRVGIVNGAAADQEQPLLSAAYYLDKALAPFAQVRQPRPGVADPILALLDEHPNVLAIADVGVVPDEAFDALSRFVENGGVLLRFAGPRLANAADELTPVRLRRSGRVLGGAMSWDTPKKLAPFGAASPFAGLAVPPDVNVTRQVLAEPETGLPAKTWAELTDGTPLVTAERRGKGLIILFHVSAESGWSNLPISGLFVDMLRRICALAGETDAAAGSEQIGSDRIGSDSSAASAPSFAPLRTLDGFGVLGPPPATAKPIPADFSSRADSDHPPGFYGAGEAAVAVQTLIAGDELTPMNYASLGLAHALLDSSAPLHLRPGLLTAALLGLILDGLALLYLSGKLRWRRLGAALGAICAIAVIASTPAPSVQAAEPQKKDVASQRDKDAALTTRLAYVGSGDARVDETSRLGLETLSRALSQRTSFAPGEPVGIDPSKDELAFYPMLYWPIVATAPQPSPRAVAKVAAYMKQGGTIVFDTRDALTSRPGDAPSPETRWLRELTKGLDIPELEIVPRDHVITKTFYLLDSFVGRTTNGETWVEALPVESKDAAMRPVRATDSVSSIVITSNDLAAAWAQDRLGDPLYPLTPGGARQRELALRGGVNLVMYTLTGNYKSDQVHVRDLLERLGQ